MKVDKIEIIGGSIAGLELARLLEGYDVVVYEEHEKIGYPLQCGEGFFKHHGVEPPSDAVEVKEVWFRRVDPESLQPRDNVVLHPWNLYFIDRPKYEQELAKLAREAGAKIITGKRVKISELESELIVDASGHPSQWDLEHKVRRKGGATIQAIAKVDLDSRDEPLMVLDWHPEFDGYFWMFYKGDGRANIGVGYYLKPLRKMKQQLIRYLEMWNAEVVQWTGGSIGAGIYSPLVRRCRCEVCRGKTVAMVGDAAGLADIFFAEGMTNAIISARILSRAIRENDIYNYERRLMKKLSLHYEIMSFLRMMKLNYPRALMFTLKLLKMLF